MVLEKVLYGLKIIITNVENNNFYINRIPIHTPNKNNVNVS